ncbi:MAG: hypothetical protein HW380_1868 [Magnetococcales bacterium]|nr:hypothetical protein [Magnetococcales bacterium]
MRVICCHPAHSFSAGRPLVACLQVFLAMCLSHFLGGCAVLDSAAGVSLYAHPELGDARQLSIAVIPFENFSPTPNAGVIAAQLVSTELYAQGAHTQPNEETVRRLFETDGVELDRAYNRLNLSDIGRRLEVDAIMSGSVPEFSYQHGVRSDPVAGMILVLTRVSDGRILWRGSLSQRGTVVGPGETLVSAAKRVAHRLVAGLLPATAPQTSQ